MSRRRATPTPHLKKFLKLVRRGPTMPLVALLGIPDEPTAQHRAEAIFYDYCKDQGPVEVAFPLESVPLANYLEGYARKGEFIEELRFRAQVLIAVDELWRQQNPTLVKPAEPSDGWAEIHLLLDEYACKSVYEFVGFDFFNTQQTWGERALTCRCALAAYWKGITS